MHDWYDPKEFRTGIGDPYTSPPASRNALSGVGTAIGWSAVILLLMVVIRDYNPRHSSAPVRPLKCSAETVPSSGTVTILDPSMMNRSDVLFSAIEIRNTYSRPIAAYLGAPDKEEQRFAVAHIAPGGNATIRAPIGAYGLTIDYGDRWCGNQMGYQGGERVRVTGGFHNVAGGSGNIILSQAADASLAISYSYTGPLPAPVAMPPVSPADMVPPFMPPVASAPAPAPVAPPREVSMPVRIPVSENHAAMDLRQRQDGHYMVNGGINGVPLQFMVDTGATTTSVSSAFAARAGISTCRPTTVKTANGLVAACEGSVQEIAFGRFRVEGATVVVLPRLEGDALLGMNVLRHFILEQRGGILRVSLP